LGAGAERTILALMNESDAGNSGRRTGIVILDDHAAIRVGLERLLGREPGFRVVAALEDERELRDVTASEAVDVLVLDHVLGRGDGLALCQRVKQGPQPPAVVVYSAYAGSGAMVRAAIAQADALVSKAEPVSSLLEAIRRIAQGERLVPPPPPDLLEATTARLDADDAPLVAMLVNGATVHDIAGALAVEQQEVVRRARRIVGRLHAGRGGPGTR
jgi:DNA-binding NarL/FixJ family response regulator